MGADWIETQALGSGMQVSQAIYYPLCQIPAALILPASTNLSFIFLLTNTSGIWVPLL